MVLYVVFIVVLVNMFQGMIVVYMIVVDTLYSFAQSTVFLLLIGLGIIFCLLL